MLHVIAIVLLIEEKHGCEVLCQKLIGLSVLQCVYQKWSSNILKTTLTCHSYCYSSSINLPFRCLFANINRSESLPGNLPKLKLNYLEINLFLVAAVVKVHELLKKNIGHHRKLHKPLKYQLVQKKQKKTRKFTKTCKQ